MAGKLFTDTTDFFAIDCGDEIQIGEKRYAVTGHERERRFGISDPKFWVKRAVDPDTGEKKLIKLTYFETFETTLGGVKIRCFRDPDKEGKILELVKDHPYFMQGESFLDVKNNNIRVLDIVRGSNFFVYMDSLQMDHKTYFRTMLPGILKKLTKAFEAIRFLHMNGFRHGDIRNDHIIIERATGNYVWIDFDYDYEAPENPFGLDVFGLGNILICAIGKGFHNLHTIKDDVAVYGNLIDSLVLEDFSILDKWRFINLRKFYPYLPQMLNDVLMHFSRGSEMYYESVDEIIEDLHGCLYYAFK
ncbi:protein kinase [Desulfobacterales bacterium HSG2]|nr:protein kinase [Desulfobacterales bacterium HSG2]